MSRFLGLVILLFGLIFAVLFYGELPTLPEKRNVANVYVWAGQRSGDDNILSFAAGNPSPNTILAYSALPKNLVARTLTISPNGRWLFAYTTAVNNTLPELVYTKIDQPFAKPPVEARWFSISADSRYLFYVSIDSVGQHVTFNFINLETDQLIELVAFPLLPAFPNSALQDRMSEVGFPLNGWTLKNRRLVFESYIRSGADYMLSGFYTADLSGIDFTRSGSYALPPQTPITPAGKLTEEASVAPDGNQLAYMVQARLYDQTGNYKDTLQRIVILDLTSGNQNIIPGVPHETVHYLKWTEDSNGLFYIKETEQSVQIHLFDVVSQQDRTFPISSFADTQKQGRFNAIICNKTLFYVTSKGRDTLYSVSLDPLDEPIPLFSAYALGVLSCAPPYAWTSAKTQTCNPFCTPMPGVGSNADVKQLNLRGGDIANGQALYTALSCFACHDSSPVAPPTKGTFIRVVNERLKDPANTGKTPEEYLAESILRPNAYVAPGYYPNVMPPIYGDYVSQDELRDLIAYLMAQK